MDFLVSELPVEKLEFSPPLKGLLPRSEAITSLLGCLPRIVSACHTRLGHHVACCWGFKNRRVVQYKLRTNTKNSGTCPGLGRLVFAPLAGLTINNDENGVVFQ